MIILDRRNDHESQLITRQKHVSQTPNVNVIGFILNLNSPSPWFTKIYSQRSKKIEEIESREFVSEAKNEIFAERENEKNSWERRVKFWL